MRDPVLDLMMEIRAKENERDESRREEKRIGKRMKYLRSRNAPADMMTRYRLDLKEQLETTNRICEEIFKLQTRLQELQGAKQSRV